MSDAKKLMVVVEDWNTYRWLIVEEGRIFLQLTGCSGGGCGLCTGRINMLHGIIHGIRGHECAIKQGLFGGQTYLVVKPAEMPTDPCAFLSNLLGLKVTLAD